MRQIEIVSRNDVKKIIKEEVDKKTFKLERLINMLNNKIVRLQEEIVVR